MSEEKLPHEKIGEENAKNDPAPTTEQLKKEAEGIEIMTKKPIEEMNPEELKEYQTVLKRMKGCKFELDAVLKKYNCRLFVPKSTIGIDPLPLKAENK